MAKKATRLMREATYRWAIWRAEGTPGELDLAGRLARQALASAEALGPPWTYAEAQRKFLLVGEINQLLEAVEQERREYDTRCRPLVEAAARVVEEQEAAPVELWYRQGPVLWPRKAFVPAGSKVGTPAS